MKRKRMLLLCLIVITIAVVVGLAVSFRLNNLTIPNTGSIRP